MKSGVHGAKWYRLTPVFFMEIPMMRNQYFYIRSIGLCFCFFSAMSFALAIERGTTNTGVTYVSGGVGQSELAALTEEKNSYSFWLTTAARGSGSYLASVRVRIVQADTRQPILEHTMDGPWLFATLPLGRYEVEASYSEAPGGPTQILKQATTIHRGDHHQMMMYFDTKDTVDKSSETPFKGNPYNSK
jgi:hypothetical protein